MRHKVGLRTLKTAVGAPLAIIVAMMMGLDYSLSAGIITILSIQNTKMKSVTLTLQRMSSTILALALASVIFLGFGFHALSFGLFLLIFIPLTVRFKLTDGIVVSSVLVTHLLGEQTITFDLLRNECLLMLVGAGIGILLNLYMPALEEEIKQSQRDIEKQMQVVFLYLARTIRSQTVYIDEEQTFVKLQETLSQAHLKAALNNENFLTSDRTYYVQYMEMRLMQFQLLVSMRQTLGRVLMTYEQSCMLADLTEQIAMGLHEYNDAEDLIAKTRETLATFRAHALPQTRDEFESRAMLFQYLNELISLLEIKQSFRAHLSSEQLQKYGCSSI